MVAVSGLLLAGAAVADTGSLALLVGAGGVLAVGTAGLTAAAHHAGTLSRWLSRRHHRSQAQRSSGPGVMSFSVTRRSIGLGSLRGR